MYDIPKYIDIKEAKDKYLLYSNLDLKEIEIYEEKYFDELLNLINNGTNIIKSEIELFLNKEKFLIEKYDIKKEVDTIKKKLEGVLNIIIMPTENCNFLCPYCYENHANVTMSDDLVEKIKKYIMSNADHYKNININWFGGEPTLCSNIIYDINNLALELKGKYKFDFLSSITTNGYLLNRDMFIKYYTSGITKYQITIDGWNHNSTRYLKNGQPTLDTIINNLKEIKDLPENKFQFSIVIRHNVLEGDNDFTWYDNLKELFGDDNRFFVLVRPVSDFGGDTIGELNLLKGMEIEKQISEHIDYLKKIGLNTKNCFEKSLFSNMCYVSYKNGYIFRANGNIEKCTVALGEDYNIIGKIEPKSGVVIDEEKNSKWYKVPLEESCYECNSLHTCLNQSCPKDILSGKTENHNCIRIKGNIQ